VALVPTGRGAKVSLRPVALVLTLPVALVSMRLVALATPRGLMVTRAAFMMTGLVSDGFR